MNEYCNCRSETIFKLNVFFRFHNFNSTSDTNKINRLQFVTTVCDNFMIFRETVLKY